MFNSPLNNKFVIERKNIEEKKNKPVQLIAGCF